MSDFMVSGGGTVFVLTPLTEAAKSWVSDFIDPGAQRWGRGVVIEHRYISDIINGIEDSGLSIA